MTTKNFSAIKLPHPRYSLEVGRFNLESASIDQTSPHKENNETSILSGKSSKLDDQNGVPPKQQEFRLPTSCLPRFSRMAHFVEVKESGFTIPGRVGQHIKDFLAAHVVIENFRPELFLRRDFITRFVTKGRIFISRSPEDIYNSDYRLTMSRNNVMMIYLNAQQYRRFGLIAKKTISLAEEIYGRNEKCYLVEIDLKDERLMKNNKYQDKMMGLLRRLSSINNIYFRFVPDDKSALATNLSITAAANELSVEYFKYVIEEYALDGCKPVPLTNCAAICQRVERHWLNGAQLHPNLNVAIERNATNNGNSLSFRKRQAAIGYDFGGEYDCENLTELMEIVNWLGYQLLSIDCNLDEIKSSFPNGGNPRYDVSCTQIGGLVDHQHVESNLTNLFGTERFEDEGVILRALYLYNSNHSEHVSSANAVLENVIPYSNVDNNSGVVYIQDCNNGSKAANEITVIGMSALAG